MNSSALSFILKTKLKNYFTDLIHRPGRLVLMIIIVAMLVMVFVAGAIGNTENKGDYRDIGEVFAMMNALYIAIFSATFITALERGGSIFKLSDVNLLFPAPFSKRSVLFFGLIQQMGASLFLGIFILYQYTNLSIHYGIGVFPTILMVLCYSLVVFFAHTCAMFVYIFVSDSDRYKEIVKYSFYGLLAALVLAAAASTIFGKGLSIETFTNFGNSLALRSFPFAGWMGAFVSALLSNKYLEAALWLLLTAGCFTAAVIIMSKSKREYYEDVLDSATLSFNAMNSTKDGLQPEVIPKKIKLGKTGIGKGEGAAVIFYKHLLENRRARVFMLSNMSLIFVLITAGFAFFMRNIGIVPVLSFSVYCGIFTLGTGRFARELNKPFVYLIPEAPVKKLIYTLSDTLPSLLVESIVTFIPVAYIIGSTPLEFFCAALAKTSFGILFLSGSLIVDRLWGGFLSKVTGMLIFILVDIILAIPGIILGIVLVGPITGALQLPMAILTIAVVNLMVSLLVFFCCRNVLQYSEL